MSPLILLFSSTLGANSNKAQGADFNSNDGGGDEGIFYLFPLFDQQIKAWHLCMTPKLQTSFLISFFWPPSSPFLFFHPFKCIWVHSSQLFIFVSTSFLFGVMWIRGPSLRWDGTSKQEGGPSNPFVTCRCQLRCDLNLALHVTLPPLMN